MEDYTEVDVCTVWINVTLCLEAVPCIIYAAKLRLHGDGVGWGTHTGFSKSNNNVWTLREKPSLKEKKCYDAVVSICTVKIQYCINSLAFILEEEI